MGYDIGFEKSEITENVRDRWGTPQWMYTPLAATFDFTIDAAADDENKKKSRYWSIDDDGLKQSWEGEVPFCNPPWTDGQYGDWVDKASLEFLNNAVTSVLVLPFNPETKGFSGVWEVAHYLIVPRRRTKFVPPEGIELKQNAPKFTSCIAVFCYFDLKRHELMRLDKVGRIIDLWGGLYRP